MAYPEFLTGSWQDSVRRVCGGVSTVDVPDALLADDLYGPESEDWIKDKIPNWSAIKTAKAIPLRRATVFHIASKVCDYLGKKLLQSETSPDGYRSELQRINWVQEARDNLGYCYYYLESAQPGTFHDLTIIDVVSRSEPIYAELIVNREVEELEIEG